MDHAEITRILTLPYSEQLLARDILRMAYVALDGSPRNVPMGFVWNGSEIVVCTTTNAPKLRHLRANP
ncbi:MAG: pyridoxamine 5'-phosphate oxidase family protein, partial [Microbacterium gubbeenense]